MPLRTRPIIVNFIVAVAYFLAARASLDLAILHGSVSPYWPPAGIAVAALLIGGRSCWPGIAAGAFLINLVTPLPVSTAAMIAVGNTLEAIAAAAIQRKLAARASLRPFSIATGWIVACLAPPLIAAGIGVTALWSSGTFGDTDFFTLFRTWWLGDSLGILVIGPAVMTLRRISRSRFSGDSVAKAVVLTVFTAVICGWVFFGPSGSFYLFLIFPILLLATLWFGSDGAFLAAAAIVTIGVFALVGSTDQAEPTTFNSLQLKHDIFFYVLALTAQGLAIFYEMRCLVITGILLSVGWAVSGIVFNELEHERIRLRDFQFAEVCREAEDAVRRRMDAYIDALYGGVSLFAASDKVTRQEWRRFVETLHLDDRYPGIGGVGYVAQVRMSRIPEFLKSARKGHGPDFKIHFVPEAPPPPVDPAGNFLYVVKFIEPEKSNRQAIGLAISSETNRQKAARLSRDYGIPKVTERITLVQDGLKRPGFLLFVPIYRPDRPHDSVHSRRMEFRGWVFAPFVTENFFERVLGHRHDKVELAVFEGSSVDPAHFLYSTNGKIEPRYQRVKVVQLAGQNFTCGWNPGPGFVAGQSQSIFSAITLSLVPLLIAGVGMSLQIAERRATVLANERTAALRDANAKLEVQIAERQRAEEEAQRARQAAERANLAKSEFLATMSHEIRTPMNAVIGFTELLSESSLTNEQREWARTIRISGESLLTIINDILDLSKIEAGKLQLRHEPFNPFQCIRDVLRIMHNLAEQKQLSLRFEIPEGGPRTFLGDAMRFRQIVLNLVSNGIKFSEHGEVLVRSWFENNRLFVEVVDSGVGIAPEKIPTLFNRFTQVDSSTTRKAGGTGLGLAICKRLIELMDGRIDVSSTPAVGTTVKFEIPLEPVGETAGNGRSATSASNSPIPEGLNVLVVEDVPTNQKLAATVLKGMGCVVDIANDGQIAVEKAIATDYDIIYMDCQMPTMDGYTATRQIRAAGRHVPIVALTASAMEGERERCTAAGMDDFMTKPLARAEFARTLKLWCS